MVERVRRFLFQPSLALWKYTVVAWLLAIVGSGILFTAAMLALTLVGVNTISLMPPKRPLSWQESIGTIIFAPVVETFLLAGLVNILSRVTKRPVQIAALSALLWGSFHALFGLLWFFGTVWSFFVFTVAYIVWKKVTFSHGLVAASLPHALVNSSAMLLLLLAERG